MSCNIDDMWQIWGNGSMQKEMFISENALALQLCTDHERRPLMVRCKSCKAGAVTP